MTILKTTLAASVMALAATLLTTAAHAASLSPEYNWWFNSVPDSNGNSFSASGTLSINLTQPAAPVAQSYGISYVPTGPAYTVTSITGTDSYFVNGTLTGSYHISGLVATVPGYNGYGYIYDNILYPSGTVPGGQTAAYLDWAGVLYSDLNNNVNVFSSVGAEGTANFDNFANDSPFHSNNNYGTFGISAVPLPGALSLFGAAMIGLGAVARRRQAQNVG